MLQLTVLPQPDFLLRLVPKFLQAQFMETLLNRIFPSTVMEVFLEIRGKRFLFCTPGRELGLLMHIGCRRIHVRPHAGETPDVTICGDLAALVALCMGLEDSDSLFFSRRLLMTGDTSTGLLFKNILTRLDFDLRNELEHHLGKRAADMLWHMAERGADLVEQLDQNLAEGSARLGGQFGLIPAKRVQHLEAELARMRETQARLERRRTGRLASA